MTTRTLTLLALAGMLATAPAAAQTLGVGAGQQGSQNYGVNAALAQAFETHTDLSFSVQSFGGPAGYLPLLDTGELDMAAAVMPDMADAMRGAGPFEGLAMENLRLIASLFPAPVGMMVAADSGIESLADLEGRRIAWGFTAQPSLVPYIEGSLRNGGLSVEDVELVPVASVGAGVDELIAGRVDATLFALRAGKVVEADSALGGVLWLPYDDSEAAVDAMQEVAPAAYLVEADPETVGVEGPMMTMAYDYAIAVNAEVSDEAVAAMVNALVDHAEAIGDSNPVLGSLNPDGYYRDYRGLPWHPAALDALGVE